MFSVYQHWDPLKVCVVGRSYPPEFYSWITVPHVRSLFEKIAQETEEDFQNLIKKLHEFGVEVLRPELPNVQFIEDRYVAPPMCPRDHMIMIGDVFYTTAHADEKFKIFYNNVKDKNWPDCRTFADFYNLPEHIQTECVTLHDFFDYVNNNNYYKNIYQYIESQGNRIQNHNNPHINGAMVSRIGKDLYFGTNNCYDDITQLKQDIDSEFTTTRNHIINTAGHSDGTYCPVCPGLIISLNDVPTYKDTFPDWEVVYLPKQSWTAVKPFLQLKEKNRGKWWIPGFENDQAVIDVVETWLGHWTGYVEETVFDVNMLVIDPKNVIVFNYNKQVFDALERHGVTPHVVPFRHRYFWDGGIHCVTTDLHREGSMQDYFPQRG